MPDIPMRCKWEAVTMASGGKITNSMLEMSPISTGNAVDPSLASSDGIRLRWKQETTFWSNKDCCKHHRMTWKGWRWVGWKTLFGCRGGISGFLFKEAVVQGTGTGASFLSWSIHFFQRIDNCSLPLSVMYGKQVPIPLHLFFHFFRVLFLFSFSSFWS